MAGQLIVVETERTKTGNTFNDQGSQR
jgi:hypothetical protein